MRSLIVSISFFFSLTFLFAQKDTVSLYLGALPAREDSLEKLLENMRAAKDDAEKEEHNQIFRDYMRETLKENAAFSYPFTKLKSVGFIDSPDGQLRIVNWNVEQDDMSQKYYCFLLHYDKKKKVAELSELIDDSYNLPPRPDGVLEATNWYGALYYKIIPMEKGAKTLYTVLGWDGNSSMSTIKLIDVLYFTGDNPKLGSPVFKVKDQTYKRIFFEHSKKAVMSLKYEQEHNRIIFDHLSPETPDLKGFYSFYVPDFSYDAFIMDNNKWVIKEDVIGVNKAADEKTAVYVKNERTGKVEKKEIKNKWVNPEDSGTPGGGSEHVAVTPEMDQQNPAAQKEDLNKKVDKKDKRDVSNMNATLGNQKKKKKRKS
jgi:hypothetical protein